ncbi:MAG: G1 family glutamic endopeptidase [Acidimicrobiales bacterium]
MPSLRPSPGDTFTSEWVGIDGATNSSLIQAGVTEEYDAATKSVLTGAWWEILPAASTPIPLTVTPGDECMVTIYQVSGTTWSITLTDTTTGQTYSTEKSYSGPAATEEWIVEAPINERTDKEDTLGQFSPNVTFSNMRATGTVTAWAKDIMVQDGVRVSVPSTLGTYGFTVAYRSASRV